MGEGEGGLIGIKWVLSFRLSIESILKNSCERRDGGGGGGVSWRENSNSEKEKEKN